MVRITREIIFIALTFLASASAFSLQSAVQNVRQRHQNAQSIESIKDPFRPNNHHNQNPRKRSPSIELTMSTESPSSSSNESSATDQLTAQERILQQTLGIEPELETERQKRISQREAVVEQEKNQKLQNLCIAILSLMAAITNYAYQYSHPITSLSLLSEMQSNSQDLTVIGKNGKPTVIDFWAPVRLLAGVIKITLLS